MKTKLNLVIAVTEVKHKINGIYLTEDQIPLTYNTFCKKNR